MIIRNAQVLVGNQFQTTDIAFDRDITALGSFPHGEGLDGTGCWVVPGLVDLHTHGAMGHDFSDGDPAGLEMMARYYARNGVTSFLATTMTLDEATLTRAVSAIAACAGEGGAKCAGIHLEGPFLSYAKRGAQAAEHLHRPDPELFHRLNAASGGRVRQVTLACEEEGGLDFVRQVSPHCTVSLGHTTADYATAMEAFRSGATQATHLYNAMPPLHHRDPGVIGAALDSGAAVELICDGLHIHPAVIRATWAMFGDRVVLVSDSLRCAGMADGDYELGGQPITLRDGVARLRGTDTLAGSAISLLEGVRRAVRFGIPLDRAVYAASTAPARAAGLDRVGELTPGRAADLLVLDQSLEPAAVFVDGQRIL